MVSAAATPHRLVETPACPLCRSAQLEIKSEHSRKRLHKCLHCGVLFVMPQPSPDALTGHFQRGGLVPTNFDTHFEVNRQPVLSQVANYIQSRKGGGAILDVGCSTGRFLNHFATQPNWEARGIELSLPAAQEAGRLGLRVHPGDTRSAKFQDHAFDVVTILDAFYYFSNPAFELAELHRILKRDGLLVMEVPWANTRLWQRAAVIGTLLNGARVPLLQSSDHLFYYTPKSVSLLLEGCGFTVQDVRPLPANRQPGALRNFLWSAYSLVSRWLWRLSGGAVFLGPRFLVIAGKPPQ
jgi:SAM-dependent methyltransferase